MCSNCMWVCVSKLFISPVYIPLFVSCCSLTFLLLSSGPLLNFSGLNESLIASLTFELYYLAHFEIPKKGTLKLKSGKKVLKKHTLHTLISWQLLFSFPLCLFFISFDVSNDKWHRLLHKHLLMYGVNYVCAKCSIFFVCMNCGLLAGLCMCRLIGIFTPLFMVLVSAAKVSIWGTDRHTYTLKDPHASTCTCTHTYMCTVMVQKMIWYGSRCCRSAVVFKVLKMPTKTRTSYNNFKSWKCLILFLLLWFHWVTIQLRASHNCVYLCRRRGEYNRDEWHENRAYCSAAACMFSSGWAIKSIMC